MAEKQEKEGLGIFKSVWEEKNLQSVTSEKEQVTGLLNEVLQYENSSPILKVMMSALGEVGCPVIPEKHICVEKCKPAFNGDAATDTYNNQIIICQDAKLPMKYRGRAMKMMDENLSHELVHMYDHCRANIDLYNNPTHVMCTEVRAANLSGQCANSYTFESSHKRCVKRKALKSFMATHSEYDASEAYDLLQDVFPRCYAETAPFDRIPKAPQDAKLAFKAYLARSRYDMN